MSSKFDSYLKQYRGARDDFDVFWRKFMVAAQLQQWTTEEKRMAQLPLFLDGDAFLVWDELSDEDKKKENSVKQRLRDAFTLSTGQAYGQFVTRTLGRSESVDAYAADLRRLLIAAGHKVEADGKSPMLIEQFIRGLPSTEANQLTSNGDTSSIGACVAYVRRLRTSVSHMSGGVSAVAASSVKSSSSSSGRGRSSSVLCFECHEVGHISRNCPSKVKKRRDGASGNSGWRPICHFCDAEGHLKKDCPEREAWKKSRSSKTSASAAAPVSGESVHHVLCVPSTNVRLPRMYVDAKLPGGEEHRAVAVVDTGSSQTLLSAQLAKALHCQLTPSNAQISAVDGRPLPVLGATRVTLSRQDSANVVLPQTEVEALVVADLKSVCADVLIGLTLISAVGEVRVRYDGDDLASVVFTAAEPVCAAAEKKSEHPLPYVSVDEDEVGNVTLSTSDGSVRWNNVLSRWELTWQWNDGVGPEASVGSGIGEYSRHKLTAEQEKLFQDEVDLWIHNGWLVPHDTSVHGPPQCVLPLIPQVQEHKQSTPVRPCLDYRSLNRLVKSEPGREAPICGDKLRKWRKAGPAHEYVLMDIRKAYLQVHVAEQLQCFQIVLWKGKRFVMQRMGFGLSVAPKMMDAIVKWILRDVPGADNYVDDVFVAKNHQVEAEAKLAEYGLATKPAEQLPEARVLGLQLQQDATGEVTWVRRDIDVSLPVRITKRSLFSWCGRVIGHYPICGWLRTACSFVKRLSSECGSWDSEVSDVVYQCCRDLSARLCTEDPVRGQWHVPVSTGRVQVWCDASDLAYGVVLEAGGVTVEDRAWLRAKDDKRHINVAELEAAIRALELAVDWNVSEVHLLTDSKTVHGWIQATLRNASRVKVSGLQALLVQRRLAILSDMIAVAGLKVTIAWVKSEQNRADCLTRVPHRWTALAKTVLKSADERRHEGTCGISVSVPLPSLSSVFVSLDKIAAEQQRDELICATISDLVAGKPVSVAAFKRVQHQLVVVEGVLYRSVKDPIDGEVAVPVLPMSLREEVLSSAHSATAHGNWEAMWRSIRRRCYFPKLAESCQQYVRDCSPCRCASSMSAGPVPKVRSDSPSRPWEVVHIDTLELGACHSGRYHCVLVCIDSFTKWAEIIPLQRHDASSVAAGLVELCTRWGPPRVIRSDNGSEFCNAMVSALFDVFGVHVRHGAVRHPQSQGSAERFNRTLLNMIRKTIDSSSDWLTELQVLLYYYRTRPHAAIQMSPMMAMVNWEPCDLIVERPVVEGSLMSWSAELSLKCARIRDFVNDTVAESDAVLAEESECPFVVGAPVLLRRPERHQKRMTPYEPGWSVVHIVSPSTVVISSTNSSTGRISEKTVNVELLKPNALQTEPAPAAPADGAAAENDSDSATYVRVLPAAEPSVMRAYGLRDRAAIVPPARYSH
ncbi:uncharacterized protein LOC135820118 [Sycon ciliatum]|uniref:uncharacterized protein LOC135820118 n=1 Tax=Sycon ciliatum TaxID=27933 RepID=UPI0031F6C4B8